MPKFYVNPREIQLLPKFAKNKGWWKTEPPVSSIWEVHRFTRVNPQGGVDYAIFYRQARGRYTANGHGQQLIQDMRKDV